MKMLLQTARHLEDLADWQHLCPSTDEEKPHQATGLCFYRNYQSLSCDRLQSSIHNKYSVDSFKHSLFVSHSAQHKVVLCPPKLLT